MYSLASRISPSRGGRTKVSSSWSMSSRNREGYRGDPSKLRPWEADRYSPRYVRVRATKASRRSSSIPGKVRTFREGKIPSFMPHRNTWGNSSPLAA